MCLGAPRQVVGVARAVLQVVGHAELGGDLQGAGGHYPAEQVEQLQRRRDRLGGRVGGRRRGLLGRHRGPPTPVATMP
ncbi:MAG TPA: hypothetical protein VFL91_23490 [Thermomicrobiales bacterium]|nr:hypothetical protein [Thermomicrobiales bacterium]